MSVLTLLRAVGHVLDKVDGARSPAMRKAVADWWKEMNESKPEPAIFWGFIDDGRNRIVKLYEHGVRRTLVVDGPEMDGGKSVLWIDQANSRGGSMTSDSGRVVSQLKDGPFAGRAERDVAFQAFRWWREVLDNIDVKAKQYQ